ncbi:MAG: sulfatase, partial [Actinomycetota bacterium]|nr:sulfatase [Actinomycetota bacterium]
MDNGGSISGYNLAVVCSRGHGLKRTLTRRDFLKAAGAAGAALLGGSGCATGSGGRPELNVILVIIDSLRKDHVGAYGNPWIKTPNLDALAKESLRFTKAYPESLPTICARRAIHTGMRTWPFRNWQTPKGDDINLEGWQPIPEGQTHLAEILKENGYQTLFVTDNMHQYKPSYNFQRGFDVFEFIRGQTTDNYQPVGMTQMDLVNKALKAGNVPAMTGQMIQYFANTSGWETEEDWFAPQVFTRASELLEAAKEGQPFFLTVDCYDPHEPWDTPEEYINLYDEG